MRPLTIRLAQTTRAVLARWAVGAVLLLLAQPGRADGLLRAQAATARAPAGGRVPIAEAAVAPGVQVAAPDTAAMVLHGRTIVVFRAPLGPATAQERARAATERFGLLLTAADRTDGLRQEPRPFVLQTALSDFYVEYQLNVPLAEPQRRRAVLSALHTQIVDVFNEYGVQITSPHYVADPPAPLIVPPAHWRAPPAQRAASD